MINFVPESVTFLVIIIYSYLRTIQKGAQRSIVEENKIQITTWLKKMYISIPTFIRSTNSAISSQYQQTMWLYKWIGHNEIHERFIRKRWRSLSYDKSNRFPRAIDNSIPMYIRCLCDVLYHSKNFRDWMKIQFPKY